jgi:hypothetical protein
MMCECNSCKCGLIPTKTLSDGVKEWVEDNPPIELQSNTTNEEGEQ